LENNFWLSSTSITKNPRVENVGGLDLSAIQPDRKFPSSTMVNFHPAFSSVCKHSLNCPKQAAFAKMGLGWFFSATQKSSSSQRTHPPAKVVQGGTRFCTRQFTTASFFTRSGAEKFEMAESEQLLSPSKNRPFFVRRFGLAKKIVRNKERMKVCHHPCRSYRPIVADWQVVNK